MSLSFLASLAANLGASAPLMREAARSKPARNNAGEALEKLTEAMGKRMKEVTPDPDIDLKFNPITPEEANADYLNKLSKKFASQPEEAEAIRNFKLPNAAAPFLNTPMRGEHAHLYGLDSSGKIDMNNPMGEQITFNPNADRAVLAHEMGHSVSEKTDIGSKIRQLRTALQVNPKLKYALAAATGALPLGIAAFNPGDDEYDQAIAGAIALSAPTLIDEGLATKNALAMMDTAGMRASLGQRAKLAGGLLSYVAQPMVLATAATALGNQFDENVPAQ